MDVAGGINVAVSFGGMVVEPGDRMVGHNDGILCIPSAQVDAVLEAALAKQAAEPRRWPTSWPDAATADGPMRRCGGWAAPRPADRRQLGGGLEQGRRP